MALGGGLYAMPMVIINMGGEMVYILAQRLQAQNVPEDKSKRVLQDVVRTMYNKMFIDELFRPQDVYSMAATRQIFDRLAHSSIMRLNESSMDKLFDLMTMGFKYQMLACSYPQELMHVTLNHLYNLRAKVEEVRSRRAACDRAATSFVALASAAAHRARSLSASASSRSVRRVVASCAPAELTPCARMPASRRPTL
jgi:hypothetical protein